jgi:hypothetical protein
VAVRLIRSLAPLEQELIAPVCQQRVKFQLRIIP